MASAEDFFLIPRDLTRPTIPPEMVSLPAGGGSALTSYTYPVFGQTSETENELMRQAYANQALNPPSGLSLSMPGSDEPSLVATPSPLSSSPDSSSQSSNFPGLLYGIGLALGSASGGARGDFSLPINHMQMVQLNQRLAEYRKQIFMARQQQLEEQKRQHDMQMLERVIGSNLPSNVKMEQLKQLNTPQAQALATGMKEADLANFKAYAPYIPKEVFERFGKGDLTPAEIAGHVDMAKEEHKFNLKEGIKDKKLSDAMALHADQRTPYQRHLVEEAQAALENKKQDTELKQAKTQQALNPSANDKSILNREAEALLGIPWNQMTQPQKQQVIAYHQRNLTEVAEAGARGREQVRRESDLAPGVMMLNTLHTMVDKPDLFLGDDASMTDRLAHMAKVRYRSFTGDEDLRQWGQIQDGMRATLARMAGEVGNLAQAEQERAKQLIPDPYGSLYGVPDSKEVAKKKLKLLGEFIKAGLEGPQGPDAQSRVQGQLRDVLKRFNEVAPLPSLGDLKPDEVALAQQMKAAGADKQAVHLELLKRRNMP